MSAELCTDTEHVAHYPWGTVRGSGMKHFLVYVDPDGEPDTCCWVSMIQRRREGPFIPADELLDVWGDA